MTKVAFMYDFDKTLCDRDMQEYEFIPSMKVTANEFWTETTKFSQDEAVEKILSYMYTMMKYAKKNKVSSAVSRWLQYRLCQMEKRMHS